MSKVFATISGIIGSGLGLKTLWKYVAIARKVIAKKDAFIKESNEALLAGKKAWNEVDDLPPAIAKIIKIGSDLKSGKIKGDDAVKEAGAAIEKLGLEGKEAVDAIMKVIPEVNDVVNVIKDFK